MLFEDLECLNLEYMIFNPSFIGNTKFFSPNGFIYLITANLNMHVLLMLHCWVTLIWETQLLFGLRNRLSANEKARLIGHWMEDNSGIIPCEKGVNNDKISVALHQY